MRKIIGIDVGKARLDVCVYFENKACMRKLLEVAHKLVCHQRAFVSKSIIT
jgi:hypothetical protein